MKTVALILFALGLGGTLAILLSPTAIDLRAFGHHVAVSISVDPNAAVISMPLFLGGLALWFHAARGKDSQPK